MAKGLEDTVFYIYNRLAALNEVGGEPQQFGLSVAAFHARNLQRRRNWPAALLATSTHDTKRSEDVRARMIAISEVPNLWQRAVQRWRMINRRWKRIVNDLEAPDANEEYLLYQTLLGTWPVGMDGQPQQSAAGEYVERIQNYMAKALHEAKVNTSWIQPNEEWDAAMRDFVANILDPSPTNRFLPALLPVVREIARLGAINSLTQTLLKLTSPGVPDIYQGSEIWDYSLVDPDNRRPVDYERRRALLENLPTAAPAELMRSWPDGRIKLFLTHRLLRFRREHAKFFLSSDYLPIYAEGTFTDCCIAFARQRADKWLVVIAPRLSSRVGFPPLGGRWNDTRIPLPRKLFPGVGQDLFTSRTVPLRNRGVKVADALEALPFAAITNL